MFFRRKSHKKNHPPVAPSSGPLQSGKYHLALDFTEQEISELRQAIAKSPYMIRRKIRSYHRKSSN